jgi:hypothetical protein
MRPIRKAQEGMGPAGNGDGYDYEPSLTNKEIRENERFQRKAEKEDRLLKKYLKKQGKKTDSPEIDILLKTLQDPQAFEDFKNRRKMVGGLAGMAGLGVLGQLIPAISRMRGRLPGRFTPQGASTHQTNLIERLFPGLFGG